MLFLQALCVWWAFYPPPQSFLFIWWTFSLMYFPRLTQDNLISFLVRFICVLGVEHMQSTSWPWACYIAMDVRDLPISPLSPELVLEIEECPTIPGFYVFLGIKLRVWYSQGNCPISWLIPSSGKYSFKQWVNWLILCSFIVCVHVFPCSDMLM